MVPLGYRAVNKELEIVPKEAEVVRRIFALYVELGSVGALASALGQQGVKPKPRQLANGQSKAAECYTIGPLAHMLKKPMYVGEVAYRGEVHKGEHPAIIDREVFDRVQAIVAERSVARTVKRGNSPHLLTRLVFDDRGNPMSPTHANKKGVRYRYYTSHALLQHRKEHAGSVSRVSAPEVEGLVCEALRREISEVGEISDRELVGAHLAMVIVRRDRIEIELQREPDGDQRGPAGNLMIPFSPAISAQKGITREPSHNGHIDALGRENLLNAIRRAPAWVEAVKSGQANSFTEIAAREGLGRRHVRRLAVLPFLAPKVLEALATCTAPADLTISLLAEALPHCWAEQESRLQLRNSGYR
jgi:hypothetical protein